MTDHLSSAPIRIALIDDHILFRESLRRLLETDNRFIVVAEGATVKHGLELAAGKLAFDLALIDYELGVDEAGRDGLAVLRFMRELKPEVHCVMVTAGVSRAELQEIIHTHRTSIFFKSEPAAELLLALEKALRGELWISSHASLTLLEAKNEEDLAHASTEMIFSPRELKVLSLITQGLSNKEIGNQLDLTESSVKAMLQRLFAKTSVRSRSQLVRFVFESEIELP